MADVTTAAEGTRRELTEEEVECFKVFGFVALRGWVSAAEMAAIQHDVEQAMEAAYRRSPFDGSVRHWLPMTGPASPVLAGFLEDPRFWDASERLLGTGVFPMIVDANRYVGDTGWHPDTNAGNQGTKFAIYLQPLTADTGALRLIPGSHKEALHGDLARLHQGGMLADGRSVPAYACEIEPGDVVAFNWPTWHATFGGRPDRRMCTVDFFSMGDDPERVRSQMRQNAAGHRRHYGHRDGFPYYDPEWLANPDRSPRRQVLIDRMRDFGVFDAVAAGESEAEPATA